tara:strand:+ start:309 stop:605 length:297 start_codon:yes stop_codon:yes gene_type:complete
MFLVSIVEVLNLVETEEYETVAVVSTIDLHNDSVKYIKNISFGDIVKSGGKVVGILKSTSNIMYRDNIRESLTIKICIKLLSEDVYHIIYRTVKWIRN